MAARTFAESGGVARLTKRMFASDSGGTVRFIRRGLVSDSGGVTRLIFTNKVTPVASPASVSRSGAAPATLTTPVTTVSVTGGIPPYTFSWAFTVGGASITITSPTTAATAFSATIFPGSDFSGTATCTVTDSIGDQGIANCGVHIFSTN